MTKEQLEKEAEEKGREWERSVLPEREEVYHTHHTILIQKAILQEQSLEKNALQNLKHR